MENALLVGLSRQMALSHELDVIANNIANIDTTGYKADNAAFSEFLMPDASDNDFSGKDKRVSFVQDRATWIDLAPAPSSAPAIRSTSPSTARAISRCRRRADRATPATARSRSTPPGSSSPATAIRCWAPADRSPSSQRSRRQSSAPPASSPCAKAPAPPTRRAASCNSPVSTGRSMLQKDGGSTFLAPAGVNADPAPREHARRARRAREIERQRRRRDGAHDRDHPQLLRHRRHPAAAGRSAPQRVAAALAEPPSSS